LCEAPEHYEHCLYTQDASSPLRQNLLNLIKTCHDLQTNRTDLWNQYLIQTNSLDIIKILTTHPDLAGDSEGDLEGKVKKDPREVVKEVIRGRILSLKDSEMEIERNGEELTVLVQQITEAKKEYDELKSRLASTELQRICTEITQGTEMFDYVSPLLTEAVSELKAFISTQENQLLSDVRTYINDREQNTRLLGSRLLQEELSTCVENSDVEACQQVLNHGLEDIELIPDAAILIKAINLADPKVIACLSSGGHVNWDALYDQKHSYLHLAMVGLAQDENMFDILDVLIDHKADVNGIAEVERQLTAGHVAALNDDLQLMQYLLDQKADPRREVVNKSGKGRTMLHWACVADTKSSKMVSLLCSRGVLVNQTDSDLNSALHLAGNSAILTTLVQNGAQLNLKNKNGIRAQDEALANLGIITLINPDEYLYSFL